ncbi:MAG: VIT1/CCC1 transporter family protein [Candidatus Paceibacterota bacterium]
MDTQLRKETLENHLKNEHRISAVANYFKEVIYGGIDGIVTTFAVVAGFSGAALSNEATTQLSFAVVLLFGLANLFADATSMGLGNFLSVRSEKDQYLSARRKEEREVQINSESEYMETVTIMIEKGFSEADAHTLATIYRKNKEYWVDFMMAHELEMSDPRDENPVMTGLATFGSFLVFGTIPLIPFIFMESAAASTAFQLSSVGTFIALVLLGLLKWRIVGTDLFKSLFEVIVVGGVAALIAFFVGTLFSV